jgi:acyl carrier protein
MAEKLLHVIAAVMEVDCSELDDGSSFETLETWDSQREVELALSLEHEYAITLNDDEMNHLRSVRDVRTLLAARGIAEP